MGEEVNPAVIKATQGYLGKYVKRPPLTEKLLGRPPFKYLHDIFSAVIKSTGFMEGLFTSPEMNPDSFKDRDSKIAYLDKVVRMVGLVNGKEVAVKSSAIVAGKEVERTNLFLQDLATAIGKKANNAEFVQRVLKGEGPAAASSKKDSSKERRKDEREDSKDRREDSKDRREDKKDKREDSKDKREDKKDKREDSKDKREDSKDKREDSKDRREDKKDKREDSKDKREDKKDRRKEERDDGGKDKDRGREREREKEKEKEKPKDASRDSKGKERADRDRGKGGDKKSRTSEPQGASEAGNQRSAQEEEEENPNRIPRPSSAKGNRRPRDGRRAHNEADSEEELQRKPKAEHDESAGGGRAPSAKPAPRVKATPGATSGVDDGGGGKRVTGVIIERDQDSDDDQFVVEEAPPTLLAGGFGDGGGGGGGLDEDEEAQDEQHGGLVKEMLKSKQQFKEAGGKEAGKTVLTTTDANRRKEKAATAREIDRLKQQLQSLTREANPLGKVIDYVQEDLDSMSKELERWRTETKEVTGRLKQEQSSADASLNGLRHQLAELAQAEKDKLDLIATVKANIVRNDERISKMIEAMSRS